MFARRPADTGVTVAEGCRKRGLREATYDHGKKKDGGLGGPELRRLQPLEEENQRLQQLVADRSLAKQVPQDVLTQRFEARAASARGSPLTGHLPPLGPRGLPARCLDARQLVLQSPWAG